MRDRVAALGTPVTTFLSGAIAPLSATLPEQWRALGTFRLIFQRWRFRSIRVRKDRRLTEVLASVCERSFTLDQSWRITSATPQILDWVGMKESDLLGFDIRAVMPTPVPLRRAIELGLSTGEASHVEFEAIAHPGRQVEFQVRPFADGVTVLLRDVTERLRAVQTDAEVGAFREISETGPAALAVLNELGVVVAVNEAWEAMQPRVPAEEQSGHVGLPYVEVCNRMIPDADRATIAQGLEGLLSGARQVFNHAYCLITKDGPLWRRMRITRFQQPDHTRFIVIHEDATELARAQETLHELSEQVAATERMTRHQIAIELHDATSQHFVALGLGLAKLRATTADGPEGESVLNDMSRSVAEASKEIRVLAYLKNPPELAEDGLEAVARRYVRSFGSRTGLHAVFQAAAGLPRAEAFVEHAAFRVLQEALSNVYRHADASSVSVSLTNEMGVLTLRVADDGKGIGVLDAGINDGIQLGVGIPSMRARVAQLGGALEITGDASGTIVIGSFPTITSATPATIHRVRTPTNRSFLSDLEPEPIDQDRPSSTATTKFGEVGDGPLC